jgi:light-regulated signal transduction histidine kinase (bacteriophytochrome)
LDDNCQWKVWKGELKNKAKDGTVYWVDTTIIPFLNQDGNPYQFVAIQSDITLRRKAEEQIAKINEELEYKVIERTRVLELQNTRLVDFCNIVSHNLRAPLINIAMLVDYIGEQVHDKAAQDEALLKIKPVISHLNEVFDELVESIQVNQDTEIISDQIILKDCLDAVLAGFENQIESYGADVRINFSAVPVMYYPQKYMDSIFTNLISNALKYKSAVKNPVINIKTEKLGQNVVLSIADNGLGIDMNMAKDRIFKIRKVFHKHPDARGFGLFITKTQVECMGGRIWVDSQVDKGSTFFIEFKTRTYENA